LLLDFLDGRTEMEVSPENLQAAYSFGLDTNWLIRAVLSNYQPDDAIREWVCGYPRLAVDYGYYVDKRPRDDTRMAACETPSTAVDYAYCIDRRSRDDTRTAACETPSTAVDYAFYIDKHPRDDTRMAAYRNERCREKYIQKFGERNEDNT
jgi:hypothetical protein